MDKKKAEKKPPKVKKAKVATAEKQPKTKNNLLLGKIKVKKKTNSHKKETVGKKVGNFIPARMNLLLLIVFALFVALIVQLANLQIMNADSLQARINQSSENIVESSSPRGMIYDATGNVVLANNQANQAILYTRGKNVEASDIMEVANRVNNLIDVPVDENLTERDLKDFWLANKANLKAAQARITADEKTAANGDEGVLYSLAVDKVTPEEINFDESTRKTATIFKRMNGATALSQVYIKNQNVTKEEVAIIGEHISELTGISTGVDWIREYPNSDYLRSLIGTVSSESAGLPEEDKNYYLSQGYALNDRVGTSYLEKQYESVLQGTKSESLITTNDQQEIISQKELYEGEKGKNILLTIDMNFQNKMEEIIKTKYSELLSAGMGAYSEGAYAVAINPKTGAIMGIVGYERDAETGEIADNPLGAINNAYAPGSVVKPATLTAGYEAGVISGNDVLVDEPIKIKGTQVKKSVFNSGSQKIAIDAEDSLMRSSNSYMMKIVFKMLGVEYQADMEMPLNTSVFTTLRNSYAQYGLGVSTGVDLPIEGTGFINSDFSTTDIMGKLLDLSYGNYDTYTPLQLAQYIATIANDGTRLAPHFVQGVYGNTSDGGLGTLQQVIEPKVLGKVEITDDQMNVIQAGLEKVIYGGSLATGRALASTKMRVAGKTGTAEVTVAGFDTYFDNASFIGYGPTEDPQIAIAVIFPKIKSGSTANLVAAREIFDAYYDMYLVNQT